jgi:hypothetical protein
MDVNFLIGLIWSLILVTWAARPEPKKAIKSVQSTKDRLFLIWACVLTIFARLWYYNWWSIFFFILEIFVIISSILMMLDTNDTFDTIVLAISWLGLVIRSLYLFEGYTTIIFIAWLIFIGLGYAFKMWSIRREAALVLGSALVALFSYLQPNRIFFRLNIFFALFSAYYLIKYIRKWKLSARH